MKVTGILNNKPRVLPKVIYLDVAESLSSTATKRQWVVFKDKHTFQDVSAIENATPGSSLIIEGKDNINPKTGQPQMVVHGLLNIIPPDAALPNAKAEDLFDDLHLNLDVDMPRVISSTWNELSTLMSRLPKQKAIGMLAKMISRLNGETSNV